MSQRLRRANIPEAAFELRRTKPKLPAPANSNPLVGTTIAKKYRIEEFLGEGAIAKIYRALDNTTGKKVAVKIIEHDPRNKLTHLDNVLREANALCQLDHPNILKCLDVGEHIQGKYYIVFELLRGESLEARLEKKTGFKWEEIRAGMIEIADALSHMHRRGVIHHDIKPDNIFIVKNDDESETYKVVDFGTSSGIESVNGTIEGTPYYVAPEKWSNQGSDQRKVDQYAFGAMLYELLTGRIPFEAESVERISQMHVNEKPPAPREIAKHIPQDVEEIILRCLEKDPNKRFEDMDEVGDEIRDSRKKSIHISKTPTRSRASTLLVAAVIAAIGVASVIGIKIIHFEIDNADLREFVNQLTR